MFITSLKKFPNKNSTKVLITYFCYNKELQYIILIGTKVLLKIRKCNCALKTNKRKDFVHFHE